MLFFILCLLIHMCVYLSFWNIYYYKYHSRECNFFHFCLSRKIHMSSLHISILFFFWKFYIYLVYLGNYFLREYHSVYFLALCYLYSNLPKRLFLVILWVFLSLNYIIMFYHHNSYKHMGLLYFLSFHTYQPGYGCN